MGLFLSGASEPVLVNDKSSTENGRYSLKRRSAAEIGSVGEYSGIQDDSIH